VRCAANGERVRASLNLSEPSEALYYRLRGASPLEGTTLEVLLSWAAVTVLVAGYAYADLYIKVVDKLSILILMGFAVAGPLRVVSGRQKAKPIVIACG
jgi:hypothetical protein